MWFNFLNDIDNYKRRKVARTEPRENNGIGISTVYTSDEGFETALIDANGIWPVERYKTRALAKKGHKKWTRFAKYGDGEKIQKLGWSEFDFTFNEIILESIK